MQVIELVDRAGLGHYSSIFSCAELFAVVYYRAMRLRPSEPTWPDRDRFLLGKGHVATGLWPVHADLGYFPAQWLETFGRPGTVLNDHPDMRLVPGVDFSSGSLGHNLSVGTGIALAARQSDSNYRTFVLAGDGELQEGQIWEAAMAASHYGLGNLVAVVDANGFSGGGRTSKAINVEPLAARFEAFGWTVREIDGHDTEALIDTFDALPEPSRDRPVCVIARTVKGKGVRDMEEAPQAWHLGHLTGQAKDQVLAEIAGRMK